MVLIMVCLLPLIVLTFLSVIIGNAFISVGISHNIIGLLENGSLKDMLVGLEGAESTSTFNLSGLEGAIAIIIVIATIAVIMGIRILGSGLSETSIKAMMIGFGYTGLWLVLSILSAPLFFQIELFGTFIYIGLTIGYVIGVVQKLTE